MLLEGMTNVRASPRIAPYASTVTLPRAYSTPPRIARIARIGRALASAMPCAMSDISLARALCFARDFHSQSDEEKRNEVTPLHDSQWNGTRLLGPRSGYGTPGRPVRSAGR